MRSRLIAALVAVLLVTASCSTTFPPESSLIVLKASQVKHLRKVALSVSVSELNVRYATSLGGWVLAPGMLATYIGLLPLIVGIGIDYGKMSSKDTVIKGQLQDTTQGWSISERLSLYIIEEINKGSMFHLDAAGGKNPSQLAADGYDGLIEIMLDEISFQRDGNSDNVHIFLRGTGKMVELATRSVIWERRDELTGTHKSHSIEEYKAEQGHLLKQELDHLLHELSFRLASDLIYAQ